MDRYCNEGIFARLIETNYVQWISPFWKHQYHKKIKVVGQALQTGERKHTDKQTYKRTDGRTLPNVLISLASRSISRGVNLMQ